MEADNGDGIVRTASSGDPEHAEVAAVAEIVRAALFEYVSNHPDPRQAMAFTITALQMHSGVQFATLMFMGEIEQQQTARFAKMASRNFREGVKVGMARAHRIAAEVGYGGRS